MADAGTTDDFEAACKAGVDFGCKNFAAVDKAVKKKAEARRTAKAAEEKAWEKSTKEL